MATLAVRILDVILSPAAGKTFCYFGSFDDLMDAYLLLDSSFDGLMIAYDLVACVAVGSCVCSDSYGLVDSYDLFYFAPFDYHHD